MQPGVKFAGAMPFEGEFQTDNSVKSREGHETQQVLDLGYGHDAEQRAESQGAPEGQFGGPTLRVKSGGHQAGVTPAKQQKKNDAQFGGERDEDEQRMLPGNAQGLVAQDAFVFRRQGTVEGEMEYTASAATSSL